METTAKYRPNIEVAADGEDLAHRAADLFVWTAREAIEARGRFYAALSGGRTPRRSFEVLASSPAARVLPWEKIDIFWVDERYVPPDSPESNYRLAAEALLKKVPIPPDNVHRIPTEHEDIGAAARAYEETIRDVLALKGNEMPQFDLIVLGMGADGHTGSLLPNSYAPLDTDDLACAVYTGGEMLNRITLTHPVMQAARHLAVLVSGADKAQTLKEVFTEEPDEVRFPIHLLWPVLDKILWLVDRAAAQGI
ncbi:MAG: 6-phosphogluconolactonase [Sedimentisphaerales bacterium]|nr:6-phosphogluconolactonase [Sedimentisphaerales bacterium]